MSLKNDAELKNTRAKLARLEARYEQVVREQGDEQLRDATMQSLKRLINQLREEIARYHSHSPAPR